MTSATAAACPPEFIGLAERMADAAGAVARRYFRTPIAVDTKPDHSPGHHCRPRVRGGDAQT